MTDMYPRETLEFIPITITVDGVTVTTGVDVCVTTGSARPTVWVAPVTLDGMIGVMTTPGTPGAYTVWARVSDDPEIPVVCCGTYRLT